MSRLTAPEPALTDASLVPSAEWCDFSGNHHRDEDEDADGFEPAREHVIEFDPVVASTDQPAAGTHDQPYALVCVTVAEKFYYDHGPLDDPSITLAGASHPHFTPAEARQLAATLVEAADRAEEIAAWRTPASQAA
jgi:hypothetical protein